MKWLSSFILLTFILLTAISAGAQSINQLQKEKEKLEKEIEFTRKKIEDLKDKRELSMSELETLQKQIQVRQDLIKNISSQVDYLDNDIQERQNLIDALQKDIVRLKEEYAKMIYHAYVNQNDYNSLLFVFSSQTFNDAFKRMRYLKEYSDFRKQQAELIKETQESLQGEVAKLEQQRKEKQQLLSSEKNHSQELVKEKLEINNKVKQFKKQENSYVAQIRKKEKESIKINNQIERMIREAREKAEREARAKAEAEAKRKAAAEGKGTETKSAEKATPVAAAPTLTPEAKLLSTNFESNKAKLPWPVERGSIIRGFGKKPHPVLAGIETNNNGVDISTNESADVRSVFDGEVSYIFFTPVYQYGVIVMHGEYFTVYLNLKDVNVKQHEKVKTKQKIGTAYTNSSTGATEVHLEIWKGENLLNPAQWLHR